MIYKTTLSGPEATKQLFACAGYNAYDKALNDYPPAWYENRWIIRLIGLGISVGGFEIQNLLGFSPSIRVSIIGLASYISGWVFDNYATYALFRLKKVFDRANIEYPLVETHHFLPEHPTPQHQLLSMAPVLSFLLLPIVLVVPSFGLGAGSMHFLAGLSNHRQKRRLSAALKSLNL